MIPVVHRRIGEPRLDPDALPPEEAVTIRDAGGKSYTVAVLRSEAESVGLNLDFRIQTAADEVSRSCFEGAELDPLFIRTQVYMIYDDRSRIGQSTLMIIPRLHFDRDVLFRQCDRKLRCDSFLKLRTDVSSDPSYIIETGMTDIDQRYRPKRLESLIFHQVLAPKIDRLLEQSSDEVVLRTCVTGPLQGEDEKKIHQMMMQFFRFPDSQKSELPLSPEMERSLGRFTLESAPILLRARKNQTYLDNIFGDGLGPVFARVSR